MFNLTYLSNMPICLAVTWLICRVFQNCLTLRPEKWARAALFLILFVQSSPIIHPGELTGTLGILFTLAPTICFLFTDPLPIKTAVTLIVYPLWMSSCYLTQNAGYVIWLYVFHKEMSVWGETALSVTFALLRIPFWILILHFVRKNLHLSAIHFSLRIWTVIAVTCLASFLGIVTLIAQVDANQRTFIIWPACVACILTNMGICYLCAFISKNVREAMEADVLRTQQIYYEDIKREQNRIRELRHDMVNHLSVVQSLLDQKKDAQARTYLSGLLREVDAVSKRFCEREAVDALLNIKYQLALQHDIRCRFLLDLPRDFRLDEVRICTLIANTLDNAIEACRNVPDKSARRILLKVRCMDDYFSYFIENTAADAPVRKNGRFLSTKAQSELHGLGLGIVQELVVRTGGTISIDCAEGRFSITALIPTEHLRPR